MPIATTFAISVGVAPNDACARKRAASLFGGGATTPGAPTPAYIGTSPAAPNVNDASDLSSCAVDTDQMPAL